jgi:hypothetical protein
MAQRLGLEEALNLYPTLETSARAQISRAIFRSEADVAALAFGASVVSGLALDEQGQLVPGSAEPAASEARFKELLAADPGVAKRFDKGMKAALTDAQRHAAMVQAIYRLGFALTAEGQVVSGA